MPDLLAPTPEPAVAGPRRKAWTVEECEKLAEAGLLDWERYELVDGDLIDTMGKNRPHAIALRKLVLLLGEVFGPARVESESPIDVSGPDARKNQPEPDLTVLSRDFHTFHSPPLPEDILLLVEVSDTTLDFDLTAKARLYARAGIAEYWVVDVQSRRLIVHREPVSGSYRLAAPYGEAASVCPLAASEKVIAVTSLF